MNNNNFSQLLPSDFYQNHVGLDNLTFTQSMECGCGNPNIIYADTNPSMLINSFGGNVIPNFVPNSNPM